jgi:hypothetical protein
VRFFFRKKLVVSALPGSDSYQIHQAELERTARLVDVDLFSY